jgi:hypothetical protein
VTDEPRYLELKYSTISRYYIGLKITCNIAEWNSITRLTDMAVNDDVHMYIITFHFNGCEYLLDPSIDSLILGQ